MTQSHERAAADSPAGFRRLIVQLGITMVAAGDAVDIIEQSLRLFVQTGTGWLGRGAVQHDQAGFAVGDVRVCLSADCPDGNAVRDVRQAIGPVNVGAR
jgi:hypothetical protein